MTFFVLYLQYFADFKKRVNFSSLSREENLTKEQCQWRQANIKGHIGKHILYTKRKFNMGIF